MKRSMRLFLFLPAAFILLLAASACQREENLPEVQDPWRDWIRSNHHAVRTLDPAATDDSDLEFLRPLLQGRTLVQLGESGHGVAEFDLGKVRLIKFLHRKLGYDVIAFESAVFECYLANREARNWSAEEIMGRSIFQVWHTEETLELFRYIKETQNTDRPLILAGFDNQISNGNGVRFRPDFFRRALAGIDPLYAEEVFRKDNEFITSYRKESFLEKRGAEFTDFYREVTAFFDTHMDELVRSSGNDPLLPLAMRQTAWSMPHYIAEITADEDGSAGTNIRDLAMADNVGALLERFFPGRKIMIWAHNFHIQHDAGTAYQKPLHNMGYWLAQRHRPLLYTIGFFMFQGEAADNRHAVYSISPAPEGSVEAIMAQAGREYCLVDLLHQGDGPGTSWMFQPLIAREWGVQDVPQVIRDQYDALFYVHTSNAPRYVKFIDKP